MEMKIGKGANSAWLIQEGLAATAHFPNYLFSLAQIVVLLE